MPMQAISSMPIPLEIFCLGKFLSTFGRTYAFLIAKAQWFIIETCFVQNGAIAITTYTLANVILPSPL